MNTSLQTNRHADPTRTGAMRPLAAVDYFGAIAPSHAAAPQLNSLSTPEFFNAGRFRQLLSDRSALKPLGIGATGAGALNPLSDLDLPATKISKAQPGDQHEALTKQA